MISRSWLFFSLAGLFFMVAGKDEARRTGRLLLLLLGPASMTIGWVFNYMFESRRMVTFLIPLITLCSVAGIFGMVKWTGWLVRRFVPSKPGLKRYIVRVLPWVMMLALLLAGARGRWHLFTTWNDKGIFDLYKEMSDRIVTEGDFLLAEYTQTAAPVESFSGLPLLPVSWGYRKQEEYRKIEEIWRDLVSSSDRERFLFISPFSGVALPGLDIEPLFSNTLETRKVGRARRSVPLEVHDKIRTVHVSRVLPPGRSTNKVEYLRLMDGSHLGLAGQANFMHNRGIVMKGVLARPGEGTEREIDVMRPGRTGTLFVMVAAPEGVDVDGLAEGGLFTPVGERWAVLRIPVDGETRDPVVLSFSSIGPVYVTDLFLLPEGAAEAIRLALPGPEVEFSLAGIHSQWLRASSAAALPVGGEAGRQLLLLATHGRDGVEEVALRVRRSGAEIKTVDETIKAGWRWHVIPLPDTGAEAAGMQWHELEVTPAWNPGLSNFPEDLGLRVAVMGTFHDLARNNSR